MFSQFSVRIEGLSSVHVGNYMPVSLCHWSQPAWGHEGKVLFITNLISFNYNITHVLYQGKPVDIIFKEVKSFDTVSHNVQLTAG